MINGVMIEDGATVQVYARFVDGDGVEHFGQVEATAVFDGNAMTLSFEPFDEDFQVQEVFLNGFTQGGDEALATTFEVRLPQHSDDDFRLQLDVTVTENPPTDGEITLDNNEATQTSFLNVEVQAVADEAVINFGPQVFEFDEDDTINPLQHGFNGNETPLRIPLTFVAELTDTDGSESITKIVVDLKGADPGAKFVLADGSALGSTIEIDGVTFKVVIDGQTLTLTADPPDQAPGQDIDMGVDDVVFIELPIDDSTDFSADVSVTTTETNPEGAVADETCTVTDTTNFNFVIEGVVGPADTDTGFALYDGEGDPGFVGTGIANTVVIDFEILAADGTSRIFVGSPYTEDGFVLTTDGANEFATFPTGAFGFPGSPALFDNTTGRTTTLTQDGGGSFDLESIDLAEFQSLVVSSITFVGELLNGGTVTETFTLDGTFGFETFSFGDGFNYVVSVTFGAQVSPFYQFDNIVVGDAVVQFVEDAQTDPQQHGDNAGESNLVIALRYTAHTQDDDGTGTPAAPDSANERNSEGITQIVITLDGADPGDVFVKADGSALNTDLSIVLGEHGHRPPRVDVADPLVHAG
ncbi:MAG: hypothetical protein IIA44_07340 [Acidobacteria bacterium]|nr:hypothetical protein [Acidobacteriota bacterium]